MYKCKPERNPRQALLLITLLPFISCVAFFISSIIRDDFRLIAQLIAVLIFTFSVITVVRYTLTEIEYSVSEETFTVAKKVGNKMTVLCSVDISSIITLVDKTTYEHSTDFTDVVIKYNHCQNIKTQSYVLVYVANGKKCMIVFEPNAIFVKLINEAIENSKKNKEEKNIKE